MKPARTSLYMLALIPLLAACQPQPRPPVTIGLANPASVYCQTMGGTSVTSQTDSGEISHCHLPTGEIIEEWALYYRDNTPTQP